MAELLAQAATRLAECCVLLAVGYNLRHTGVLKASDGETAIKVATTLTVPSLIVQALGNGPPLSLGSASLLGVATVCMGSQLASTWLYCMNRSKRERAVLAGSCTGLSLRLFGYPIAECFLGGGGSMGAGAAGPALAAVAGTPAGLAALQAVALVDFLNHCAVWLGSYMLFAGAGPAFPESFKHEDGGDYRGQWRGMRKEGLGVYTYASGARYEGEWRNNVKEGRGVYYFPKGGVYEGEWSGGVMNGLGVRTFSTGQVKAGRWRDGQLDAPLELWQVALAADGAAAVAAAARNVEVGGGRLVDAAHMLVAQPTLWALLAGLAVNLLRVPLPTSVDVVTAVLAQANTPLMLLAAGITAPTFTVPSGFQQLLPDIARLLGARLLVPLSVGLTLLVLMGTAPGGSGQGVAAAVMAPLVAALMALLAPVPPQALINTRRFRLNEATAAALTAASYAVCIPLMILTGVAACAAGLAPYGTALPATPADPRPLLAFTAAAVVGVSAAVGYAVRQSDGSVTRGRVADAAGGSGAASTASGGTGETWLQGQRVLMVYAGPVGTSSTNPSNPASSSAPNAQARAPGSSTTSASPSASSTETAGPNGVEGDRAGGTNGGVSGSGGAGPSGPLLPPPRAWASSSPPPLMAHGSQGAAGSCTGALRRLAGATSGWRHVRCCSAQGAGMAMWGVAGSCRVAHAAASLSIARTGSVVSGGSGWPTRGRMPQLRVRARAHAARAASDLRVGRAPVAAGGHEQRTLAQPTLW